MSQIKIDQIDLEYYDIDERIDRKQQKEKKSRCFILFIYTYI